MISNYYERANRLATVNTEPTMTDQSQANDTDINVIVKRYGVHGTVPGTSAEARFEDLSNFPDNLRDVLDTAREIDTHLGRLPDQLKGKTLLELMALTPDDITNILTPEPTPAPTEEKK